MLSKDAIVFIACCFAGVFALGIEIGKDNRPLTCPLVAGQQIVSTVDSKTEQTCHYATSYGRAVRKMKL